MANRNLHLLTSFGLLAMLAFLFTSFTKSTKTRDKTIQY